jgi:hypothetical protein
VNQDESKAGCATCEYKAALAEGFAKLNIAIGNVSMDSSEHKREIVCLVYDKSSGGAAVLTNLPAEINAIEFGISMLNEIIENEDLSEGIFTFNNPDSQN